MVDTGNTGNDSQGSQETVAVRAYSPDAHPILVLERDSGELCVAYYETGYDLARTKQVGEEWLEDNAVGRHSFVRVSPPRTLRAGELGDYVRDELGA